MELQLDQIYRKPVHQYWHYCSWDFPFRNQYPKNTNTATILNIATNTLIMPMAYRPFKIQKNVDI